MCNLEKLMIGLGIAATALAATSAGLMLMSAIA